jgi:hypothetical protein
MAFATELIRIITGIGDQISMGYFFLWRLFSLVAFLAGNLSVNGTQESSLID